MHDSALNFASQPLMPLLASGGTTAIVHDMAICITVAWVLAVLANLGKQPLILAYLIAGYVIGPSGMEWVTDEKSLQSVAELGLVLLLFMIGLEIDLKKILRSGKLITLTGASQILGGFALGVGFFFVFKGVLGLKDKLDIIYLAVAAALSSTVIVVKSLYEKRELDTLPGRITVGILVLQDLFAILFLAIQPNLDNPQVLPILKSIVFVVLLVAVAFTASRYALPPLFKAVARLPELVQVGALAWCFLVGEFAAALGLSREMGALVAGVAISTYPYTLDVAAKVTSLRDFFITLFFITQGMTIPHPTMPMVGGALLISVFVILSRLVTVFTPLHKMYQGHRASFLPGLNLCQISEFSVVILALGVEKGHIGKESQGILIYAFAIMAAVSCIAIVKSEGILRWVSVRLSDWGVSDLDEQTLLLTKPKHHPKVFFLGFAWTASSLLEEIAQSEKPLLDDIRVIDFNPQVNTGLRSMGVDVVYGDISQRDTLLHAHIETAEIIICTLSDLILKGTSNRKLVLQLRELNPTAKIIMHANLFTEVPALYQAGADYVFVPRIVEAREALEVLNAARQGLLEEQRHKMDQTLQNRHEVIG